MPSWSRAELSEWVRGKQIYARDGQAGNAPAPEWLLAASDGWGPGGDSAGALERTHPEDRHVIISTYFDALSRPGQVVSGQVRARGIESPDEWTTARIEWLNLLDDPEVGCLVSTICEEGPDRLPAPVIVETGAFAKTRWMVLEVQSTGRILSADGKVFETLGHEPSELVGHVLTEFIHPDALADGVANWVRVTATPGATSTSRRPWKRKDGGFTWMEASYLNRVDDSVLVVVWDITEKLKQEQELADVTAQFQILADEVPAAVFCCDLDGVVLFHNARWASLVDDRPDVTTLFDLVAEPDHVELSATLSALAADERRERRTIDVHSRDGVTVWRVALRSTGDPAAGRVTVVGSIADVTATVRWQAEARHDALTGVLNRHGLDEVVAEVADPQTLVVFIDLDRFKPVNDEFGHDVGDMVLTEVARRLAASLRPGDAVGRFGGDEFVVVCRDVASGGDAAIVRRVEEALAGSVTFEGGRWEAAASIGVARFTPGDDLRHVLRRADLAMLQVKRERRACADHAAR
ncbi:PAS domain S-box-containing protein/diguanylate cyclase (GGDEF) domain-containing protein [Nocardioides terrae]|uniref:PAS domain S-box-containing protein/diguanylate cyclase (GGDEF) domain-containing protein n=1 Tax=Nocardioides terrae TaxID=574651 RepID=A0A1I1KFF5_9ACTN|nr:sensor domain-containing diguanylate cyclase [Nocardioides terrae]SFC59576.1 PAS domain S-box-containing protein/diguanylate cyclase (GGDEF) domain-containing protein [Nocardioides terrae]